MSEPAPSGASGVFTPAEFAEIPPKRAAELLTFIQEASRATSEESLTSLLQGRLRALLGCECIGLFMLEGPTKQTVSWMDSSGTSHSHKATQSLAGLVAKWQKPRWFTNPSQDPGYSADVEGTLAPTVSSLLAVPIKLSLSDASGSLLVVNKQDHTQLSTLRDKRRARPAKARSGPDSGDLKEIFSMIRPSVGTLGRSKRQVPPPSHGTSRKGPSHRQTESRNSWEVRRVMSCDDFTELNRPKLDITPPRDSGSGSSSRRTPTLPGDKGEFQAGYVSTLSPITSSPLPALGSQSLDEGPPDLQFSSHDQAILLAAAEAFAGALDRLRGIRVLQDAAAAPPAPAPLSPLIASPLRGRRRPSLAIATAAAAAAAAQEFHKRLHGKCISESVDDDSEPPTPGSAAAAPIDLSLTVAEHADLCSLNLRPWTYSKDRLIAMATNMFVVLDLTSVLKVSISRIGALIERISENYDDGIMYHNFIHAFDVMHCVFYFILKGEMIGKYLTALDAVTLLLAAALHDVDHLGFTNGYLVSSKSPYSMAYGTSSVMEKHHIAIALSIMSSENILSNLSSVDQDNLWSALIKNILATDISNRDDEHQLQDLAENNVFVFDVPMHRRLLMRQLMRAADISNACKPTEIAVHWAKAITAEFFRQGDIEREKGLPISNLCDRNSTQLPDIQTGFIKFLARPTLNRLTRLVPELAFLLDQMDKNLAYWTEQQDLQKFTESLKPHQYARIRKIFAQLDTNNSGTITVDSLKVFMRQMSSLSSMEVRDIIAQLDMRGEGELSFDDFCRGAGPYILSLSLWPKDPVEDDEVLAVAADHRSTSVAGKKAA